ncbi:integrase catalytic subunit [Rhodovulum sulfidophilum]|uniref:Integrase catalytic subunit n=1 Tax=Rhodovulum sulfidophilum TaxID=35806 RepID=A0A0D6B261_RHOSU|nr:integrase catalytic subunit [Rhodovulum sulfidophilum]
MPLTADHFNGHFCNAFLNETLLSSWAGSRRKIIAYQRDERRRRPTPALEKPLLKTVAKTRLAMRTVSFPEAT